MSEKKKNNQTSIGNLCWPTFEDVRDAVFIADPKTGKIIDCNQQATLLLKRKKEEIIGLHQRDLHPPEEAARYEKIFKEHVRTKGKHPVEAEIIQKNGKRIPVEITARLVKRIDDGYVLQGVFRDITERKRMVEDIRASRDQFRAAFQTPSVGIALVGLNGRWLEVNPALCRILGYPEKKLLSSSYQDVTYPADQKKSRAAMSRLAKGKVEHVKFEKRYIRPDKSITWAAINASLVRDKHRNPQYVVSIIEDITDRKLTEAALAESEVKFRNLAENALVGIYIIKNGVFQYVNPKMAEIFGYTTTELINKKSTSDLTAPVDRDLVTKNLALRLKGKIKTIHYRFNGLTKLGAIRRIDVLGSRMMVNGEPAIIGTLLDVTEDEHKDFELRDRAEELNKFQLAVAGASDHIIITDPDGMILYANAAAERITGFPVDDMLGKNAGELWGGRMDETYYKHMWRTISVEKKTFKGEVQNHRKNGEPYTAETTITPILNKQKKVIFFVGIERDITKAKEIDRMKSEFISVASHQLRTPLSTAGWYIEMLMNGDGGTLTEAQQKFMQEIARANQRSIALINALLSVSRIDSGKMLANPKPIDIVSVVNTTVTALKSLIEKNRVSVVQKFDSRIPDVMVDPEVITLVMQNLVSNAVKYTPAGGRVTINGQLNQDHVTIDVQDNGIGIPENVKERLFTKFFRADNARSKDPDGTGLGLYIAKSAVELSGGKIWFTSTEGKGTTFSFTIPLNQNKTHARKKPPELSTQI